VQTRVLAAGGNVSH